MLLGEIPVQVEGRERVFLFEVVRMIKSFDCELVRLYVHICDILQQKKKELENEHLEIWHQKKDSYDNIIQVIKLIRT